MRAAAVRSGNATRGAGQTVSLDGDDSGGGRRERTITIRKRFSNGMATTMHNNQRVVPPDEERVDALLQHMAGLDVPSVRYMAGQFVPDFDTTVAVADGITARVTEKKEADGDLHSITIALTSTRRTVGGIRSFLEDCFHNYRAIIQNKVRPALGRRGMCAFLSNRGGHGVPCVRRQALLGGM